MATLQRIFVFILSLFIFISWIPKEEKLQTIPVNSSENIKFPLSEIVETVKAIDLEFTDQSMIRRIKKVIWNQNHILVLDISGILLFDTQGKFIRGIGKKGQGPGEYSNLVDMAVDFESNHIYVADTRKILCYDFGGGYLSDYSNNNFRNIKHLTFLQNKLYSINEFFGIKEGENKVNRSVLFIANENSQITDSLEIRKVINPLMAWTHPWIDFVNTYKGEVLVYNSELNAEPSLRDTVFRISDRSLVPQFRLDFQKSGIGSDGKRILYLYNIWRSSRFVFSVYGIASNQEYFRFCYDTKKQKGFNMKDGYFDDLHTKEIVDIRPLSYNSDQVYYTYTKVSDETEDEPNPTLYIATLKK